MIIHRCGICNKTNSEEVISDLYDYTDVPFVPDPENDLHFICLDCFEEIRDTIDDFGELEDGEEENLILT